MATFNEEDRKWLYDTMKSKGINTGSYDDFKQCLDNDEDRQWYYDKGKELGLNLGSKEYFDGMMWENNPVGKTDGHTETPETVKVDGNTFTESQLEAVENGAKVVQQSRYGTPEYANEVIKDDLPDNPYAGMTRQQAVNAIGEKYRKEWYGKPGAYENIKSELASYNIASPSDYGHITAAIRNYHLQSVARQRVEQLLSPFKNVNSMTFDDVQEVLDSRATQKAIDEDVRNLGLEQEDKDSYYQELEKQLEKVLTDKYGYLPSNDGRGSVSRYASSLINGGSGMHEERIREREAMSMIQGYLKDDIDATVSDYDRQAQEVKESTLKSTGADYSVAGGSNAGMQLGSLLLAQREANKVSDPEKILKDLTERSKALFDKMLSDEAFISNVMKQSEALGIEPDQYVADYVIPSFMKSMQREFSKSMTARELPKGRLDYIMRGLTDDSIIGMLVQKFVMTDSQIQYRDMANAKYGEGANIWLQGARMATGMASDFWLWGGWGKLGGAATRSLLNQRIMALAASKRITREAATRIMEEEARQYLSKGLFEHIMRHVPQSAVTMGGAEATTEAVRGYTRNEEIGDVLLNTFKSGMSGAATGTAFGVTGGAASRLTSQLSGVKRLAGKLAGLEVEAATLYTTEELQKMLSGDDAFENPFEGMFEANVKLGFIKASANPLESAAKFVNAVAHPVKTVKGMMEPDSKVLTEEDVADLRETFDGKGLVDAVTTMRPVRHTDGSEREGYITEEKAAVAAQAYNDYMANPDRPIDRKQRVARLLGGIVPPAGKEVRIDIDTTDGKTVLRTRDAKGQCVQELYFDSHQEAEAAANEMLYTIDQNTTTVLEDRISETAVYDLFRQKIDEEYQKVAAKYGDGVNPGVSSEMTETEKKWVYLHQHLDELLDITQAISDGRELGIDGQNLAEQFLGMFVEYSSSEAVASDNANRLRNAFEQQYGLNPGELDEIIRKGPGKRSDVESTILGEYQEFLRKRISDDDAAGKTDGHTEGTEGQAGGEAGAVNGTGGNEPPAGPATPDGETVGNIVIGEGQGEGQAIARSERRQAAYDRGKQAVQNPASLAAITYDSHLASLRLQQQFPENDPVLSRLRKDLMKAIVEGNDDEAERLMDLNAGNMNSRQKEAVEQYRDAIEMSRGVDDAVTEAVQAFQRQRHDELRRIAAADGTVTELTLADGSKAYYISGDLNNKYSGVIVANEQGETKQKAVSRIATIGESVPMDAILRADVDAYGQQLQQDLSGFASGTSLIPGSTVELGIGSYLVQVQYVGNDATGNMVFKEGDGRQSVFTPQDVQQFVQEANRMKMESQLRQEKTAAIEQARADRFGKGIVGYSDGKADVSHKNTDAKVAAEYLEANVSSGETAGHSALLKSIQGEIDKLNELSERSRETVSRMAAKQELQGLSEQEEIALGESQAAIDDAAGRRRKWGEIRQALMTDEERRKFESERQKEIKKAMDAVKDIPAGKPLDTLAVPTGKELLEQYEEQGDAENAVETLRANLKAQYRDDVYPRLASVREAIEDYRRGLSDLTTDEINELAVSQKQLESQETAMMKQSQELKNLASYLGRLYAGRKKQQLSPHEYKMQQLEKETNKAKKLNLAKEAFADDEEALAVLSDLEPQDIYEHIADNLGEGSLSWEGFDRGEHHVRGVVDMVGKDKKRGIGKDSDTIGYNTFLAPTGQGKGYDEVVHAISEGSPYSTEDVANTLYDMLSSASKPTDISHRIIDERIARAEEIYEANREREREAEEDAKREALDQEIMQMTGMDPDEYDAYISDLESRLAEQEGYRSSEDYFNQTVERYEREQERNAGGSQETGALGLQGQEGEQGTGEGAAEEGAGGADAIAELQSDVNEFTSKYHSLPAEVISLDIPDAELIEKLGIPQYVIDHFGSEQKACEAVRNSLKEKKTVAAYNRESNKIIIFATAKRERIPEAMFHENVHGVLRGWYGDKEQSIATNFWNLSPDEGGKIDKSYIQKRYDEDEWKTEFFVTWLGRAMVDGTVDDMLKILSDPGDFERVNNILNAIGYDRAKETAERQGSGRLAEDNSSADGGRPEEGEVDAAGETDGHTEAQDFSARLAEAKSETNTNPTEEQKKAGNYKMGHISFGGYRMSIENPKGSTRSGKDANGKAWSIEMQDTYGYIGKKYGADGDHLDFFINDDADLDNWNGRVYVVDQGIPATDQAGKPLGTLEFDEHKVMYGYPSFKAAKEAYERNYEAGWWDKHVIGMTGVRKDTFDAWLNDSDHKRKPFAEYSRTRNAETITDNVDQLLADVRERAMKEIDELKNITTTYKDGELEKRSIAELEQLKKKRKQDASIARYSMRAFNIKAGSEKEHTLMMNEAQANADIKAIDEELKRKKEERQAAIEQQEMGFAVTDRLNEMGYDVETNPSEVRRVRKIAEKDQSKEGKMRHMQTTDGTVYGFVYRGKMYIDIRKIDGNLPLHEYAHPWCEAFRKMNPDGWKAVVKTMQTDKDTWEFVKQLNPDLKTEDDIAEEMIAKGTGEKGEQYARAEYERMHGKDGDWKSKWNNIWKNIAKAIQDFWKQVGDYLHIKYESPDQVYDQVIRDFANNVNPKKKMEQWLKERDKSYLEAVKTGDEAKAKELFDAALRENIGSGIVPFVSTGGYRGKLQKLAHGVKSRDPKVIAEVADLMAPIIPKDAVLVPAPSHGGEATDMLDLANAISERTGAPVADVLKSKERGSQYDAKKAGKPLSTVDLGITIDGKLPESKLPVVIDNVVDTGNTAEACVRALGKGIVASLADSKGRFKRVTTLKSAEPVVTDKKGNVVPLSKRFELPFQFMVEGNLFSDADFDEPETATEVALTGRRLNKYGLNEDTTIGKKLTEFLDKNDAPNLLAGYVDSKTGDYVILGESVNDIEEYADANQLKNAGDMDGMAYVRLTSKDFDILSPKLVKEGYKMAFVDDKTDKPTKPKDAVDTMLDEVERRKEVASQKESEKRVKEYLDKHVKGQDAEVRKRATKAVLKAMDKAGVPYKVVSKEEERQMMQIFSMMNQAAVKNFCRRADIRSTSRHGFGRYCVYNMADPFAVPMYHEKLSNAKEDVKQLKRMAPQGAWEILDIGYADEVQNDKELTGKAADMNLAELQAEIETWHGSGAVFTKFDNSHMGEGAGSQMFGWGTYLSNGRDIGESYSELSSKGWSYEGKYLDDYKPILNGSPNRNSTIRDILSSLNLGHPFEEAISTERRYNESAIRDYEENINDLSEADKKDLELYKEELAFINSLKESDFESASKMLYKVNIPDDTGENYLDYKKPVGEELAKKIRDFVYDHVMTSENKGVYEGMDANVIREDIDRVLEPESNMAWMQRALETRGVTPKEFSQWLSKQGYVGIKYPAGTIMGGGNGATNYVIFNEGDAKIVDTIQFMMGDEPAGQDAPIFVSNALKAVEGIKQEKATPEQWLAMITKNGGLKAGEDKWIGLSDWLKEQKGSISKQDILDYIRKNQIEVEEQDYSETIDIDNNPKMKELRDEFDKIKLEIEGNQSELEVELDKFEEDMYDKYGPGWYDKLNDEETAYAEKFDALSSTDGTADEKAFREMVERYGVDFDSGFEVDGNGRLVPVYDYNDDISDAAKFYLEIDDKPINDTRLAYTTKGLDNKREIALVVPTVEPYNESDSIHFGDAGGGRAVAWVRFGETTVYDKDATDRRRQSNEEWIAFADKMADKYGTDGSMDVTLPLMTDEERQEFERINTANRQIHKERENSQRRVLVIDEIQSKRHQDARELGYQGEFVDSPKKQYEVAYDKLMEYKQELDEKYGEYHLLDQLTPEERAKYDEMYQKVVALSEVKDDKTYTIPDAPFEKNWHELAMKRMLRYAAEHGYDKVAWTKGEQQAERYSLGGSVKNIQSYINDDGTRRVNINFENGGGLTCDVDNNGTIVSTSGNTQGIISEGMSLNDVVGKELGQKIVRGEGEVVQNRFVTDREVRELSGNNLRIGGEGMKGFYDQILPRFMDKYGKKWGVKVGEVELPDVEEAGRKMWSVDVTPEMKESVMEGQPMFQKEGKKIMGWSDGKQVYLTEAGLNPNTPLHETTHLWDKWCQKEKPELWKKVVDAMKKTAMWEEISKNPNYRNIWNDDNRMASEVHSRLSGAKGEDEFMKAAFKKDTPQSIIDEVKSVLRKFWESILRLFGKTTKTIGDEWSSLDAIIRMPLRDLLNQDFEKVMSVVESDPSMQAQAHIETDKADMEHKQRQLEIVTKANPMLDDYHTGIRKLDDIKTFEEAYLEGKENAEEGGYDEYASYPDITNDMIEEARKTGKITIYSSKPIKDGVFVTPSMMNAKDYAGNGKVYSKEVPIEDVAWINLEEGQYAKGGDSAHYVEYDGAKPARVFADIDRYYDEGIKPQGDYGVMPRLGTPRVEAANERFNDELDKQISGELPKGHVYQLGKPGAVLLSTGFPNDNIELSATHLLDKSKAAHHPFELSDVKDLVRAINTPLAVFSYGDRSKAQNVIAEIQKDGKNFVVGIHFNQNPRGMVVSDIIGLYPKDNAEWLNWITQGKLLYANKEKIQNLIDKQRRTLAEVDYLDLNFAAKIVKDFENPKLSDEKIREIFPDYTNAGDNAAEQLGGVKVIWEQQTLESGTKGWYDPNTNTVHVAIDEVEDVDDAVRTVYHEKLGHEGLVALFATVGKTDGHTAQDEVNKFGQFVFKSANAEIRKRILDKADEEGYEWTDPLRHSKAAQEVLCDIAADGPRTGDEFTLWEKVKHYIIRLLNKLNIRIPGLLNDHDLAYYIVKTGEALKRWNGMSETARENLASQSTRYDIMRSRGGKPRKRNDESYSQYLERLRAWEKWKIAKETAFANGDPIPDQKTFNDKWEEAYRRDMDAWRNENHIPDTEMPGTGRRTEQSVFPKREDGESVQEYAKRVAEYETQKDILKTAPNYFEYVQKAQDEYKKAYTEWRERYDLEEAENVDLKVYEGEGGDGPRTDADVEAEGRMERDLADAVGVEIDSDGAKRHAKLAVIERRKNLESSNAEDAIWLYDFIKMTDDFAGKLPGTVTGKMLREALPFIIEGTYWEEIVRDENGYPIGINDLSDQMPIKKSAELDELLAHVKEWYDEFYHLLEDAGLRNDAGYVENYVNHIWDKEKSDPKAWEKYVENYQRTKSPNMRHREIDTYQEGIDVGLVPKYKDIADMIAHYSRQNNEAIANKRFLEDLSGFVVDEVNSDGETVSVLPLLNSEKPDEFVRDRYSEYYVPGVGDVYVLKDVKKRFASIFGPLRTQDVADWLENAAKVYDLTSSTMKKIQLSISGFHALALSEVAVAQMRPDIAAKALVKYIILDSVRNKTIPAYAHPEDFMFAASHLVQLGATQDYAASDVNNITGKLRELMHELYESDGAVKKAAGAAGSVPAIMLDWVNKGMDKILWNYLHDGLKIACFKMFAEQIDERVKKEGLSEDLREKLLDEAGQYVNDTFGGQYFELLNITPATMKWLRRILLSPDWLISTQRHFFANFGFGSLYSDSSFKNYLKFNADNIKRAFGADIAHDELRRFRSKNAKQCYLLGVCFFFYTMWNALNAMFRYQDEKNEREKADEIRKENPDYRSPYELAYPDGMKWYDYTMLGNGLGQQTHLFLGRYEDGSEEYVRWGKQFREFPEMFIGRHGVEFPTPLIERMQGKSNPMVSLVRDNLGALGVWGFTNSKDIEEIQAKYGKTIGVLAMNARHFLPFSVPTQAEKEFKAIDLLMPSQKGFTRYKTVDFFKTYIQAGDMEGIAKTYQAAVMNNIDAESCLKAAISTLNATQRKEMSDGVTDLTLAVERFDKAESLNERRQMREKIRKYLSGSEYKLFTRDEAIQQVNEFLDGGDMEQMTVNSQRYLMLQTSEDVIEDWKVSRLKSKSKEYSDKIKKFRDEGDDSRADALERTYEPWLEIKSEIGSYEYYLRRFKADLGDGKDAEVMKDIRQSRKELLHTIDSLRPPR